MADKRREEDYAFKLLVEGPDDLFVIAHLRELNQLEDNIFIKPCGSVEKAIELFRILIDKQTANNRILGLVIERDAVAWAVGIVSPEEIDKINILNASFLAMHRAVDRLKTRPQHLLIDGNRFKKYPDIPHTTVIKGDGKYLSIAAASILAKTYRDDYMNKLHQEFPCYDWEHNKGYPTKKHRAAIAGHGTTPYHRMTFNLLGDGQLELFSK